MLIPNTNPITPFQSQSAQSNEEKLKANLLQLKQGLTGRLSNAYPHLSFTGGLGSEVFADASARVSGQSPLGKIAYSKNIDHLSNVGEMIQAVNTFDPAKNLAFLILRGSSKTLLVVEPYSIKVDNIAWLKGKFNDRLEDYPDIYLIKTNGATYAYPNENHYTHKKPPLGKVVGTAKITSTTNMDQLMRELNRFNDHIFVLVGATDPMLAIIEKIQSKLSPSQVNAQADLLGINAPLLAENGFQLETVHRIVYNYASLYYFAHLSDPSEFDYQKMLRLTGTILGVGKNATEAEIKAGYRQLSLAFHPDGKPEAIAKSVENVFKIINEANEQIKRARQKLNLTE